MTKFISKLSLILIFVALSNTSIFAQSGNNSVSTNPALKEQLKARQQMYSEKEQNLIVKYKLTDQERIIVNKAKGRELTFSEKIIYARAMNKHAKHAKKRRRLQEKKDKEFSTKK